MKPQPAHTCPQCNAGHTCHALQQAFKRVTTPRPAANKLRRRMEFGQ